MTPAAGGHGATLSILVVEDDQAAAELLRAVLNAVSGCGASVVHDAAGVREVFLHVRIGVLVLHVNLPGITGRELAELVAASPTGTSRPLS